MIDDKNKIDDKKLMFDYEQTTKYIHALADVRFKLLALVPLATGITSALIGSTSEPQIIIPISMLGLLVTIGIIFYDQRNTQIYNALQARARSLEVLLELPPISNLISIHKEKQKLRYGGPFIDRPKRGRKFFGMFIMWHDRALAIIYSSVVGVWSYLLVTGLLHPQKINNQGSLIIRISIPILVSVIFFINFEILDRTKERVAAYPESIMRKLTGEKDND